MTIVKWVGGKQQIVEKLLTFFPKEIDTYYELFLGGGAVLINLLECKDIKIHNIVVNDINTGLINMYLQIKDNHKQVIECLENLSTDFKALPEEKTEFRKTITPPDTIEECKNRKEFYYYIRHKYNVTSKDSVTNACYFIFLNKVGFRGLYRESNGKFNVPYGNYKNPNICNKEHIEHVNGLFSMCNITFLNRSFTYFENVKFADKDFVYLDPPYYPTVKNSFTAYTTLDFKIEQHERLACLLEKIPHFLMSNSYTDWVIQKTLEYTQEKIICKRRINANNPNALECEILVYKNEKNTIKA
jgi:DNA adenine methylase